MRWYIAYYCFNYLKNNIAAFHRAKKCLILLSDKCLKGRSRNLEFNQTNIYPFLKSTQ